MGTKTKRTLSAWLLLSVFASMMSLSALHRHESMANVAIDCVDCAHHIHHGHLTAAADSIHECLLCQFIGFNYVAATITLLALPTYSTISIAYAQPILHSRLSSGHKSTRAPPYVLKF